MPPLRDCFRHASLAERVFLLASLTSKTFLLYPPIVVFSICCQFYLAEQHLEDVVYVMTVAAIVANADALNPG